MSPLTEDLIAFATGLPDSLRARHREVFERPPEPIVKADKSPVTALDIETEDALRALIEQRYPDHGVVGEERPTRNPSSPWTWIIDPIDGTKSFLAGVPMYTILIGLAHEGRLVLGVVDQPILGTRWVGGPDTPTRRDGALVRTRDVRLAEAFVTHGSLLHFKERGSRIDRVTRSARWTMVGRDSYLAGLLASGRVDAVILDEMNLYDYAALVPVVVGAGGVAVDAAGAPIGLEPPDLTIFAANAALAREIVAILA